MTDYLLQYLIDYLPEEIISEIIRPYSYNYLPFDLKNNINFYFLTKGRYYTTNLYPPNIMNFLLLTRIPSNLRTKVDFVIEYNKQYKDKNVNK